ncbi:MAG TPA: hypothetical protein IAB49_02625 [Candidatus Caccenecus avistercoris]|nr:hypothetical protein [Candidatus Caccenecus avistercoris]
MKKKVIIIVITAILLIALAVSLFLILNKEEDISDAAKFAEEYTNVEEDNVFLYRNADEIIRILENGTGVVYLGFPECKWCQKYVTYLNEAAKENDITRIYYFDILDDRSENTSEYQQIVSLLEEYLEYDEEGNKRVFVPAVIVVDNGEIVGFDDETSLDTHDLDDPEEYWTEEEVNDLMSRLATMFDYVNDGTCNECNE